MLTFDPELESSPEEALKPFLGEFFQDRLTEFQQFKELALANDLEARKLAHKWKGMCKPYGFGFLGMAAQTFLEADLSEHQFKKLVEELEAYFHFKAENLKVK